MQLETTGQKTTPPAGLLKNATLLLDFDGTLVELAARPDAVHVDEHLRQLVTALRDWLGGRFAFVSGRDVATLQAMLGLDGIAIAGSHGLEILHANGRIDRPVRPPALDNALHALRDFADARPGLLVEDKPLGAALHYRLAPEEEAASNRLARQLAEDTGLKLQTGKKMVELRLGSGNKGMAVERLMAEPGMTGTLPVFVGDDDTDEPGFLAAGRLSGHGVLVGPERASAAHYRLPGVVAVHDWLRSELQE